MNRFKIVYETILNARYVATQEEFSKRTEISRTIVSQLLNGRRELNRKHISRICEAFPFVNATWLSDGTGDMLTYDLPIMPSEEELDENQEFWNQQARQYEEEQIELENLKHKASLYDDKVQEVKSLYSQLSETMKKLQEKEAEISTLNGTITALTKTIQLLRTRLAGLLEKNEESALPENPGNQDGEKL